MAILQIAKLLFNVSEQGRWEGLMMLGCFLLIPIFAFFHWGIGKFFDSLYSGWSKNYPMKLKDHLKEGLIAFNVLGLIASYFYHAGNLFWSWLNHHNKRLNQQYYNKKRIEKLESSANRKRLTASKREIQIRSLERALKKSDQDNKNKP